MMSQKKFALVKWIGGEDDKKYSPDVPVDWIKNFKMDEFESDSFDPSLSYVIEWHSTKKMPQGGWPVYDGYVIAVSHSLAVLKNKLKALDGILSPKSNGPETSNSGSNESETQRASHTSTSCGLKITSRCTDVGTSKESSRNERPVDECEATSETPNLLKSKRASRQLSDDSDSDSIHDRVSDISGCARINRNKRAHKQLYETPQNAEQKSVASALIALQKEIKKMRKNRCESSDSSTSNEDDQKEIGRRGSGVVISSAQWEAAKATKSYTAMGISLMMSLFPMKVLLNSNLRGGRSRIHEPGDAPKRPALNQNILDALFYTVKKNWKKTFTKAGLGIALNSKLSQLRTARRRNQNAVNE